MMGMFCFSLFSDLKSLSGTTLLNFLSVMFLTQVITAVGTGGLQVRTPYTLPAENRRTSGTPIDIENC